MKKSVGTKVIEDMALFCDMCDCRLDFDFGHDHASTVKFHYGYHSRKDGESAEYHFCSDCAEIIEKYINKKINPR